MPISSLGVIFRLKSIMRKYLEKCKTYKIKPLLKNQHPLFVWSDMIRFSQKSTFYYVKWDKWFAHELFPDYRALSDFFFFFFVFPRSMKFNHLEVSLVLLCYIYLMKWNGLWLRFWHSLLSPKSKGYILSIRGEKKIPSHALQAVMPPVEGSMKNHLSFPIWSQPCFWQRRIVLFIIYVVKSLKTMSSERCFTNMGALQWIWNFSNVLLSFPWSRQKSSGWVFQTEAKLLASWGVGWWGLGRGC